MIQAADKRVVYLIGNYAQMTISLPGRQPHLVYPMDYSTGRVVDLFGFMSATIQIKLPHSPGIDVA